MQWSELEREACSLARTLALVGDRWTLLILRDCFLRVRRFDDFHARLGIGRPILADRLRRLVAHGVLARIPYQQRPARFEYRLTPKGLDLWPVVMSLVHFGDEHLAEEAGPPLLHRHRACGQVFAPVIACSACGEPVGPQEVEVLVGPGAAPSEAEGPAAQP